MSTRSLIALQQGKTTRFITNLIDGYPTGVGQTLIQYYDTIDKVSNLINKGCASVINKDVDSPRTPSIKLNFKTAFERQNYYQQVKDRCEFEYRDWGNPLKIYELDNTDFLTYRLGKYNYDYLYLFKDGEWHCGVVGETPAIIGLVKTLLTDIPKNIPSDIYNSVPFHFKFYSNN